MLTRKTLPGTATILLGLSGSAFAQNATDVQVDASAGANTSVTNVVNQGVTEDTPVLNIATPNAGGLSHNFFTRYDVGTEGLVINNHGGDRPIASSLAGAVLANPNLSVNNEARVILNEITSSSRSRLFGPQELVGGSAEFILANPNGVTCSGCGFLNFPKASIITGSATIDAAGRLGSFDVDGGDVSIEGDGLDATTTDYFDIVSRSVAINGQINAKNLTIVTGRNLYDYGTGIATKKADDPSGKPEFGIDSSALGGMYADRITLVGTEDGVGVRLRGDAGANTGDMTITADGKLVFRNSTVSAKKNLRAVSSSDLIEVDGSHLTAGDDFDISAASLQLLNGASINAGDSLSDLLTISVDGQLSVSDSLVNSNGALQVEAANIAVDAASTGTGKGVRAVGYATLKATDSIVNAGFVASGSKLTLEAWNLIGNKAGGVLQAGTELSASDGPSTNGILANDAGARLLAPVVTADLGHVLNYGTVVARSTTDKSVFRVNQMTNSGDADPASTNGLIFAGAGIDILASHAFYNINDAFLFANTADITLGGIDMASAQGLVRNENSTIESRTGDVRIFADTFQNTGTLGQVVDGASSPLSANGWHSSHFVGTQHLYIVDTCGSLNEGGLTFRENLGKTCARSATQSTQSIDGSTDYRSRLFAGKDIEIYVRDEALNRVSIISAANDILIDGATGAKFTNEAQEVYRVTELGEFQRDTWTGDGHFKILGTKATHGVTYRAGDNRGPVCFHPGKLCFSFTNPTPAIPLVDQYLKVFEDIDAPVQLDPRIGIMSTVEAGNGLQANIAIENTNVGAADAFGSITASAATAPVLPSNTAVQPSSPLFVSNPDPAARFLYQTDPLFSVTGLLGSADFLARLGYDPNRHQFLGDAYYEQQYLRQQILSATGQRFVVNGLSGEDQQYKVLLDRGEAVREAFDLRVGVSLTPQQIASLQEDVVLLVETEVDGRTVLAPKLYLAANTERQIVGGALIAAADIAVDTDGAVANEGTLLARNSITIDSGESVENRLGLIGAGGAIDITAEGDIANLSGTIAGSDVALRSTDGSVINQTLKNDIVGADGNTVATVMGDTASISADGDLTIEAKDDIVSLAADISAGGDAELSATDIDLLGTQKVSLSERTERLADGTKVTTQVVQSETQGANLDVAGNLVVRADDEFAVRGSDVDVGGDAEFDVANLSITSQEEVTRIEQETEKFTLSQRADDGAVLLLQNEQQSLHGTITTQRESTVTIGGSLSVGRGEDEDGNRLQSDSVEIAGSNLSAGGDAQINARDVTIRETVETTTIMQETTKSASVLGGKTTTGAPSDDDPDGEESASASFEFEVTRTSNTTENLRHETARSSNVDIGGSLTISSEPGPDGEISNVNISGSNVDVEDRLKINAGNVTVEAAQTQTTYSNTTTEASGMIRGSASTQGLLLGGALDSDTDRTRLNATDNTVSEITAGGIEILASGEFTDRGTRYDSDGDIVIRGEEGVNFEAAIDSREVTVEGTELEIGIDVQLDVATVGNAVDAVQDKVLAEEEKQRIEELENSDPAAAAAARENPDADTDPAMDGLNPENIDDIAPGVTVTLSAAYEETVDMIVDETARVSELTSRSGGINISSGETGTGVKLEGTRLEAQENIEITAQSGAVDIGVAETRDTRTTSVAGGGGTVEIDIINKSVSASGEGYATPPAGDGSEPNITIVDQDGAEIRSGGEVVIRAEGGDAKLTGTKLAADDDITITGENVELNAATDTVDTRYEFASGRGSLSLGKGSLAAGGGGHHETSEKHVQIAETTEIESAGGDIRIEGTGVAEEGGRISSEGTDFSARNGDVSLTGSSVELGAASNIVNTYDERTSVQVEISATKSGTSELQDNVDGGLSASGDGGGANVSVEYQRVETKTEQAVDSSIEAENLFINATDGDVETVGGSFDISEDVSIQAEGGSVIFDAAENTHTTDKTDVSVDVNISVDMSRNVTGGNKPKTDTSNDTSSGQNTNTTTTTPQNQSAGLGDQASPLNIAGAGQSAQTPGSAKKSTLVESVLAAGEVSASISVEDTTITERRGGTLDIGGTIDIGGDDIEFKGTQLNASGGSLDAEDGDIRISSAETTMVSETLDVSIGVSGEYQHERTTKLNNNGKANDATGPSNNSGNEDSSGASGTQERSNRSGNSRQGGGNGGNGDSSGASGTQERNNSSGNSGQGGGDGGNKDSAGASGMQEKNDGSSSSGQGGGDGGDEKSAGASGTQERNSSSGNSGQGGGDSAKEDLAGASGKEEKNDGPSNSGQGGGDGGDEKSAGTSGTQEKNDGSDSSGQGGGDGGDEKSAGASGTQEKNDGSGSSGQGGGDGGNEDSAGASGKEEKNSSPGNSKEGSAKTAVLNVEVSQTSVDISDHQNAELNFGEGELTVTSKNLTIEGGKIEGGEISVDVSEDLTITSVANESEVSAVEFTLDIGGSAPTIARRNQAGKPGDTSTSGSGSGTSSGGTSSSSGSSSAGTGSGTSSSGGDKTSPGTTPSSAPSGGKKQETLLDVAGLFGTGAEIEVSVAGKTDTQVSEISGIIATEEIDLDVGGTTTVNAGIIDVEDGGKLDLETGNLVIGDDIEGTKSQSLTNFRFAATATNLQKIVENSDSTEDGLAKQGLLVADAQSDESRQDQTVRSTIGEGRVTITGEGGSELEKVNRDGSLAVETTGEYRDLNEKDGNQLAGDIAQDAVDDLNSRIESEIDGGVELKQQLDSEIALESDDLQATAETVARVDQLNELAGDIVSEARPESSGTGGYFGQQLDTEQTEAVYTNPVVVRTAALAAEFKELQRSGKEIGPTEMQDILDQAGFDVDLAGAADPQAAYDQAVNALMKDLQVELSEIIGKPVDSQQLEAFVNSLGGEASR